MFTRSLFLALVALMLAALPASAAPVTTIGLRDDYFSPGTKTVSKGTRVVWVNRGRSNHTVTTRSWSVRLDPGERYSRRVRQGFRYVCVYHGAMAGRVVVR
jgi:plastocyanin